MWVQHLLRLSDPPMNQSTAAKVLDTLGSFTVTILEPLTVEAEEHEAMSEVTIPLRSWLGLVLMT